MICCLRIDTFVGWMSIKDESKDESVRRQKKRCFSKFSVGVKNDKGGDKIILPL